MCPFVFSYGFQPASPSLSILILGDAGLNSIQAEHTRSGGLTDQSTVVLKYFSCAFFTLDITALSFFLRYLILFTSSNCGGKSR